MKNIFSADKFERWEWDNNMITYANDPDRTRVLYIGDSISVGIRNVATACCNERIIFDGFATSRGIDNPTFVDALRLFASQEPNRRAILFNNGLHGWHLEDSEEFGRWYESVLKQITDCFEEPVIVVLCTAVTNEDISQRVKVRNQKIMEIASKYKLPVIDLFGISEENTDKITDGIHFSEDGYRLFADKIINFLGDYVR